MQIGTLVGGSTVTQHRRSSWRKQYKCVGILGGRRFHCHKKVWDFAMKLGVRGKKKDQVYIQQIHHLENRDEEAMEKRGENTGVQ